MEMSKSFNVLSYERIHTFLSDTVKLALVILIIIDRHDFVFNVLHQIKAFEVNLKGVYLMQNVENVQVTHKRW